MICVRRRLTEPKTALAEAIDETLSARFVASIAAFNASAVPSRPPGCWDSVSMIETRGDGEKTVRREGCGEDEDSWKGERRFCHETPRANGHAVKRIVFIVIALKRDACSDRVVSHRSSTWAHCNVNDPSPVLQLYPQTTLGVVIVQFSAVMRSEM